MLFLRTWSEQLARAQRLVRDWREGVDAPLPVPVPLGAAGGLLNQRFAQDGPGWPAAAQTLWRDLD